MFNRKKALIYIFAGLALSLAIQAIVTLATMQKRVEIPGKIEEICCEVELLKDVNNKITQIAEDLSGTLFFKIFRVNLFKDCPFWVQEFLCTSPLGKCQICQCDENEIPLPWRKDKTSLVNSLQEDLFIQWETKKHQPFEWHAEEKDNELGIYVDLKKNPEVYTGYQGQNIWSVIYGENCFSGPLHDMCIEERLLNRIISGLHTSISTQLCEYYNDHRNRTYPNIDLFFQKVGNYEDRILNLYFAHSVLLRAINRAHEHIQNYTYDTGNFREDLETKRLVDELFSITLTNCDHPFDEKELFANLERAEVNKRFISYFHNISRIMDCVECETCKVYGKLQTYGIGRISAPLCLMLLAAALKILFAEKFTGEKDITLKRNELIALMVTFYKFSTSITYIDKMFERRYEGYKGFYIDMVVSLAVSICTIWVLVRIYQDKTRKLSNQLSDGFKAYAEITGAPVAR